MSRIVEGLEFSFVGLQLRDLVTDEPNSPRIQALWRDLKPRLREFARIEGAYGVCIPGAGERFSYMAAVAVDQAAAVPPGMVRYAVAPQTYAAFPHDVAISTYDEALCRIWATDLPATGREYKEGGSELEVYPELKEGLMQAGIWIPVV